MGKIKIKAYRRKGKTVKAHRRSKVERVGINSMKVMSQAEYTRLCRRYDARAKWVYVDESGRPIPRLTKAEREQRGRHPLQVQNEREAHERQQKKFQRDVRKNDPLFVSKKPPTVSGGLPSLGKQ